MDPAGYNVTSSFVGVQYRLNMIEMKGKLIVSSTSSISVIIYLIEI